MPVPKQRCSRFGPAVRHCCCTQAAAAVGNTALLAADPLPFAVAFVAAYQASSGVFALEGAVASALACWDEEVEGVVGAFLGPFVSCSFHKAHLRVVYYLNHGVMSYALNHDGVEIDL